MPETTDPTYQTRGGLLVTFRNMMWGTTYADRSGNISSPDATVNPPTYGPGNKQPPKRWIRDRDWEAWEGMVPTAGTFVDNPGRPGEKHQFGAADIAHVKDMSGNSVAPGHTYCFTADVCHQIRLCWILTGVSGGSTINPGFGLYNLTKKPNEWSYVLPLSFDKTFLVELLDPDFREIVKLSVEWAEYRLNPMNSSRLNFSIQAAKFARPLSATAADPPQKPLARDGSIRELELLTAEGAPADQGDADLPCATG